MWAARRIVVKRGLLDGRSEPASRASVSRFMVLFHRPLRRVMRLKSPRLANGQRDETMVQPTGKGRHLARGRPSYEVAAPLEEAFRCRVFLPRTPLHPPGFGHGGLFVSTRGDPYLKRPYLRPRASSTCATASLIAAWSCSSATRKIRCRSS